MIDNKAIGARIKDLREEKTYSQEQLATLIDVSPSAISMYEQGVRVPRDEIKVKIAKLFSKSVDEIFFN